MAFMMVEQPERGGPPLIDLGPLMPIGIGLAATMAAFISLVRSSKPDQKTAPKHEAPVLPVAKASRSRRTTA